MRKTKMEIFGTIGPACSTQEIMREMFENGLTGMRLNMSHTSLKESRDVIQNFHNAGEGSLLIDLQGPEVRVHVKEETELKENLSVTLSAKDGIVIPDCVFEAVEVSDEILLDDGKILLYAERKNDREIECIVKRGGILKNGKSIKITGKTVYGDTLTQMDLDNLKIAKEYGVNAVMQPFVHSAEDLKYIRSVLDSYGCSDIRIFAKIENMDGVENLSSILPYADMIVIARGDLGNDMELWHLPAVQKEIEKACRKSGTPFLVVTEMLSSMIEHPVPTRAEVSDIFNAAYDGCAAVMVTGETAVGKYPAEVIRVLANTAYEGEKYREKEKNI